MGSGRSPASRRRRSRSATRSEAAFQARARVPGDDLGGQHVPRRVRVLLDGHPISAADAGADVHNGYVTVHGQRLYGLISLPERPAADVHARDPARRQRLRLHVRLSSCSANARSSGVLTLNTSCGSPSSTCAGPIACTASRNDCSAASAAPRKQRPRRRQVEPELRLHPAVGDRDHSRRGRRDRPRQATRSAAAVISGMSAAQIEHRTPTCLVQRVHDPDQRVARMRGLDPELEPPAARGAPCRPWRPRPDRASRRPSPPTGRRSAAGRAASRSPSRRRSGAHDRRPGSRRSQSRRGRSPGASIGPCDERARIPS